MARSRGIILPEDLMVEILSWLPVKSLMRFKCVCKSWCGIIASPDFVSLHLKNYYNNDRNNDCFLITTEVPYQLHLHFVPIVSAEMLLNLPNQPFRVPGIDILYIFGPCNGIFCVMFSGLNAYGDTYALWNPAIKKFRVLPPPHPRTPPDLPPTVSEEDYKHGFGLDPITNDYKLVLIKAFNEIDDDEIDDYIGPYCPSRALVYSLVADSWKNLEDLEMQFSFQLDDGTCYMYVNGMCYWEPSYDKPHNVILSFDMAREVFQDIKGPDCLEGAHNSVQQLSVYNDSIAFFVYKRVDACLDIWVIDDGYWIKKISVGPLLGVGGAIGYWKNEQVILESENYDLLLCDSSTGEIRDLRYQKHDKVFLQNVLIYKDSLVSITNGDHIHYLAN